MSAQYDLFGNLVKPGVLIGKNVKERKSVIAHRMLLQINGESAGNKCGKCVHMVWRSYSKSYPKCLKSGCMGHTQNHDWSSRWQACGLFKPND